ncbi:hypothetical protein DL93DRAFT_2225956 [Clavulina sp. PMI_390]|nr:hypothetical protein DL93DRAFT_2225956 [Clavulina sp. PMI_390]
MRTFSSYPFNLALCDNASHIASADLRSAAGIKSDAVVSVTHGWDNELMDMCSVKKDVEQVSMLNIPRTSCPTMRRSSSTSTTSSSSSMNSQTFSLLSFRSSSSTSTDYEVDQEEEIAFPTCSMRQTEVNRASDIMPTSLITPVSQHNSLGTPTSAAGSQSQLTTLHILPIIKQPLKSGELVQNKSSGFVVERRMPKSGDDAGNGEVYLWYDSDEDEEPDDSNAWYQRN